LRLQKSQSDDGVREGPLKSRKIGKSIVFDPDELRGVKRSRR
jgi:hypothetical protein